jgi:phage terminase large subunit GpA
MRKPNEAELEEIHFFNLSLVRGGFEPREKLSPAQWTERHFRHGANSERFDLERFPFLREPLDCISDYRVEEQLALLPPQVGKSLTGEAAICYYIVEDPGDLVAYTHTIPLAKMWSEQRVMPSIKKCEPCRKYLPQDPRLMRTLEILMPHMVIEVAPANLTQTQSRSRRLVICDERWLWESGRYDNAKRRADSPNYEGRRKIISFSNSGDYESDVELQWRGSDQRVLFSNCPACGREAPYKFSEKKCRRVPSTVPGFSIRFDENTITRPSGVWNINEVVKTVRLVCPHCQADFEDIPKHRVKLRRGMHYISMNPTASTKSRAWAVSGVAVYPWPDLVKQFLNANQQLDLGDNSAMREFILKGLNEPWSEDVIFDLTTNATGDYDMTGEAWSESTSAALTVDYQELAPYFWFVVRDWTDNGRSRLRKCGMAHTWEQIREIQQTEKLPDRFVHVDCSYRPDEVYEHCARYGWLALRGRPEDYFIHSRKLDRPVRRYFSEMRVVDPAIGTDRQNDPRRRRAIEFMWADSPVKDILARLYSGKGVYFGVPRDVPQYYVNHMNSERKAIVETRGNKEIRRWVRLGKRPNHLWDCEAMQICFALIKGPLRLAGGEDPAPAEPS